LHSQENTTLHDRDGHNERGLELRIQQIIYDNVRASKALFKQSDSVFQYHSGKSVPDCHAPELEHRRALDPGEKLGLLLRVGRTAPHSRLGLMVFTATTG
jgi:hypothetical protein